MVTLVDILTTITTMNPHTIAPQHLHLTTMMTITITIITREKQSPATEALADFMVVALVTFDIITEVINTIDTAVTLAMAGYTATRRLTFTIIDRSNYSNKDFNKCLYHHSLLRR